MQVFDHMVGDLNSVFIEYHCLFILTSQCTDLHLDHNTMDYNLNSIETKGLGWMSVKFSYIQ